MSRSSFHTELSDPGRWLTRFLHSASGETHRGPAFEFIHLISYPPSCVPWFRLLFACVYCIILSSLGDCYPVTSRGEITVVGLNIFGVMLVEFWSRELSILILIEYKLKESKITKLSRFKMKVKSYREEENLVFWFGAQFNSTLNFTQSGWLILFSPDLHFRLAKRVSGQTHSLRRETATRTDVLLAVPA